jgi:flagellar motility protein MotE (MotC chaperone)
MSIASLQELEEKNTALIANLKLAKTKEEKATLQEELKGVSEQIKELKSSEKPKVKPLEKVELDIMNKFGVDKIWKNSRGEYFTMKCMADMSDDPKKVVEIDRKSLKNQ